MTQIATGMSVTEAINRRCSVRSYTPEKVGQDAINGLLAAAVRSPTAIHEEPWAFLIVQDADKLKRISERAKAFIVQEAVHARLHQGSHMLEAFSRPDFNVFYNAGTLIVICADKTGPFVAADCWLAAENLMLTARSMGLGTCVIGSAVAALNAPDMKAELGIPVEATAVCPIIVGVPAGEPAPTSRKAPRILG